MLSAEAEYLRRDAEIEEYIAHIESLEGQTGISVTLMNTMKSSALLMLYNQVESTMTNLIQDVFDDLGQAKLDFNALNAKMKTLVLSYAKRRNPGKIVDHMIAASATLVIASFDKSDLFSGNLDCKKIRETLDEIGVSKTHGYKEVALSNVKQERNDLAHGSVSFSDCGKKYTAKMLWQLHQKTRVVLSHAIADFTSFINNKAYT